MTQGWDRLIFDALGAEPDDEHLAHPGSCLTCPPTRDSAREEEPGPLSGVQMRLADYVVQTLVDARICECFSVVGGASMFLNDAFATHPGMRVTYMAHENVCVNAAESYFRLTGRLACVCITAGPRIAELRKRRACCLRGLYGYRRDLGTVRLADDRQSRFRPSPDG